MLVALGWCHRRCLYHLWLVLIGYFSRGRRLREMLGRIAHETAHGRNAASSFGSKFAQLYRGCLVLKQTIPAAALATVT